MKKVIEKGGGLTVYTSNYRSVPKLTIKDDNIYKSETLKSNEHSVRNE